MYFKWGYTFNIPQEIKEVAYLNSLNVGIFYSYLNTIFSIHLWISNLAVIMNRPIILVCNLILNIYYVIIIMLYQSDSNVIQVNKLIKCTLLQSQLQHCYNLLSTFAHWKKLSFSPFVTHQFWILGCQRKRWR